MHSRSSQNVSQLTLTRGHASGTQGRDANRPAQPADLSIEVCSWSLTGDGSLDAGIAQHDGGLVALRLEPGIPWDGPCRVGPRMDSTTLIWMALFVLGYGLVSKRLERTVITPPMVFVVLGLMFGGGSLAALGMNASPSVIHVLAELTLVLVLFGDAARIDLRVPVMVDVELAREGVPDVCRSVNVSRTGIRVEAANPYPLGCSIQVGLVLPGNGRVIRARAEVIRRIDKAREGSDGFAARFLAMSEDAEQHLVDYVERSLRA